MRRGLVLAAGWLPPSTKAIVDLCPKTGDCNSLSNKTVATEVRNTTFLVLLALFPLLTPLMGRPYAPKPDKWGASRPGCLRNPQQDAPQAPHQ